jgi:hypothetical protein
VATEAQSNIHRLQNAGFAIKVPLPEHYEEVLEGLGDDEMALLVNTAELLVRIQRDLEQAGLSETDNYSAYIVMPPF